MVPVLVVAIEVRSCRVANVHGVLEIELVGRAVGRQEGVGLISRGHLHRLVGVGEREAVHVHHHRQAHPGILRHGIGHERQIERLLVVLGIHLDPAMIEQRQRVALVAVDVPRQRKGPVRVHHHNGKPAARGVGEALGHIQQPLGRGGRERARTRGRGADGGGERRVLAFHVQVLGGKTPLLHHGGERLHDRGLGRDGIGGDHLGPGEPHPLGEGLVAGKELPHAAPPSVAGPISAEGEVSSRVSAVSEAPSFSPACSSTMAMQGTGHTFAHTPQPLQKS